MKGTYTTWLLLCSGGNVNVMYNHQFLRKHTVQSSDLQEIVLCNYQFFRKYIVQL